MAKSKSKPKPAYNIPQRFLVPTPKSRALIATDAPVSDHARIEAPFAHLLVSNDAPGPADVESILDAIDELDAVLEDVLLASKRERNQQIRRDFNDRRTRLEKRIRRYTAVLSPVRLIPVEILALIFEMASPVVSIDDDVETSLRVRPCFVLVRVCRKWRGIARGTPSLWSALVLPPSWHHKDLKRLEWQLEHTVKSANPPQLDVYLSNSTRGFLPVVPQLVDACRHWRTLTLDFSHSGDTSLTWMRGVAGKLDALVALRILGRSYTLPVPDYLTSAPCLRAVALAPPAFPLVLSAGLRMSWTGLTRYRAKCLSYDEHFDVLLGCPGLEDATLAFWDDVQPSNVFHNAPPPSPAIELHRLRRLYISNPILLDYLHAPVLERLTIENPSVSRECITRFLDRNPLDKLTHLALFSLSQHPSELLPVFGRLSSTTALVLLDTDTRTHHGAAKLFTSLQQLQDAYCPLLRSLAYGFRHGHLAREALFELVRARALESVCIFDADIALGRPDNQPEQGTVPRLSPEMTRELKRAGKVPVQMLVRDEAKAVINACIY